MRLISRVVEQWLLPTEARLSLARTRLEKAYAKDIAEAFKAKDFKRMSSLQAELRFETDLHDEEVDAYITRTVLSEARRLKVPVPSRINEDNSETEYWYEGHHTGGRYLTREGLAVVRAEIRSERRARHEDRAQWVQWLTALAGVIGALTGLVAVLTKTSQL